MYEDYIGRLFFMNEYKNYDAGAGGDYNMVQRYDTDDCGESYDVDYIWRTNYTPFGVDDYSFDSTGIDVGSDSYCNLKLQDWLPPFRFPGQYSDWELEDKFVYNHWRFYMPEVGRYTSADPLGLYNSRLDFMISGGQVRHLYSYTLNNPVTYYDADGLSINPATLRPVDLNNPLNCILVLVLKRYGSNANPVLNVIYGPDPFDWSAKFMRDYPYETTPYIGEMVHGRRDAIYHCTGSCMAHNICGSKTAYFSMWYKEWFHKTGNLQDGQDWIDYEMDTFNNQEGKKCSDKLCEIDIRGESCYECCRDKLKDEDSTKHGLRWYNETTGEKYGPW